MIIDHLIHRLCKDKIALKAEYDFVFDEALRLKDDDALKRLRAIWPSAIGALAMGLAGYLTARGGGITYLGQFYNAGDLVAAFTASGIGLALGGLIGGAAAILMRVGDEQGNHR